MKRVMFCACAVLVILVSANGCALSPGMGGCDGGCASFRGGCDTGCDGYGNNGNGYGCNSNGQGGGSVCSNCGMQGNGGILGCPGCGLFARMGGMRGQNGTPYGHVTPHPAHGYPGPSGPATATYAYPYYTIHAPRDFLVPNPPSLGR